MNELRALRMRKDELETHLTTLQDSRRQLMIQLEGLMKMLKVRILLQNLNGDYVVAALFLNTDLSLTSEKHGKTVNVSK